MYNFAFVGTLSIFYQKGIPMFIEQAYLVLTSVIVAWQLCQLPEWSVWALLLLLALWDFFAVMSPIGPLKWLIQLIQDKGTPLPGLLFEANINQNAHLVGWTTKTTATNSPTTTKTTMTTPSMTKNPTNGCSGTSTNNIHIGLGDFIFYSVLAGRAAIHGMTVFTVCFINLIMVCPIYMYLYMIVNHLIL
jgi:presenilin 1